MTLTCPCGTPFELSPTEYKRRIRRSRVPEPRLYCSRACDAVPKRGANAMEDWSYLGRLAAANDRRRKSGVRVGLALVMAMMLAGCESNNEECLRLCFAQGQRVRQFSAKAWDTCTCGDDLPECRRITAKPEAEAFK
jgi:hypothetical protein